MFRFNVNAINQSPSFYFLQIFTMSFVESQQSKDDLWLQKTAEDADLEIDEDDESNQRKKGAATISGQPSKKALSAMRMQLKRLLDTPIETFNMGAGSRRKGFVVVAK